MGGVLWMGFLDFEGGATYTISSVVLYEAVRCIGNRGLANAFNINLSLYLRFYFVAE